MKVDMRKTILVVEDYPYEADLGGDGAYVQSLVGYLRRRSHRVFGIVVNPLNNRTKPFYRSVYPIDQCEGWFARGCFIVGRKLFFPATPGLLLSAAGRIVRFFLGRKKKGSDEILAPDGGELKFVTDWLRKTRADAVILVYDAVRYAEIVSRMGVSVVALVGSPTLRRENLHIGYTDAPDEVQRGTHQDNLSILRRSLSFVDLATFASSDDLSFADAELRMRKGVVMNMGYAQREAYGPGDPGKILYVGNNTSSNCEGLKWFLGTVWPDIASRVPAATLRIVGKMAMSDVAAQTWSYDDRIQRVGIVRDLTHEYAATRVVVAPLVSGTAGVKIKVAEAISHGRPLVSTSVGVDPGSPGQLDAAGFVTDDPQIFSFRVAELLENDEIWAEKAKGARSIFSTVYSETNCYQAIDAFLDCRS